MLDKVSVFQRQNRPNETLFRKERQMGFIIEFDSTKRRSNSIFKPKPTIVIRVYFNIYLVKWIFWDAEPNLNKRFLQLRSGSLSTSAASHFFATLLFHRHLTSPTKNIFSKNIVIHFVFKNNLFIFVPYL